MRSLVSESNGLHWLRITQLQIALALYEVEQGRPAAKLDDLVPRYLPALPIDPYSGQSFNYRVARLQSANLRHSFPARKRTF